MLLKAVVIFLLVMMLIGMLGKLFNPAPKAKRRLPGKCPTCGSFIIGKGPCQTCAQKGKK